MIPELKVAVFCCALAALPGCKRAPSQASPAPSASSSAGTSGTQAPRPSAAAPARLELPPRAPMPTGPRLAVLAGQGLGPIRFGATVSTIERLMEAPCDEKTPVACRYFSRAIEFELKDGVTDRIRVHRFGRKTKDAAGHERDYGMFNGAIPPTLLSMGMIPSAFREDLGPPLRVEQLAAPNAFDTVERYYYPGMVLEFDRHPNGNLILGGIILEKSSAPPQTQAKGQKAAPRAHP